MKAKDPDSQSISQLGGWIWEDEVPREGEGGVTYRFYQLHRKPIGLLSRADLRFLIGQNACLEHLVPKALSALQVDPWLEAEYEPGDLLSVVLRINHPKDYWRTDSPLKQRLVLVAREALKDPPSGISRADLRSLSALLVKPG